MYELKSGNVRVKKWQCTSYKVAMYELKSGNVRVKKVRTGRFCLIKLNCETQNSVNEG